MLSPKEILILETAVGDLHLDRNNGLIWAVVHSLRTNKKLFPMYAVCFEYTTTSARS